MGRSTPKISKHLAAIRPAVVTLDASLKPHFKREILSLTRSAWAAPPYSTPGSRTWYPAPPSR
jgi:hypothetical protein